MNGAPSGAVRSNAGMTRVRGQALYRHATIQEGRHSVPFLGLRRYESLHEATMILNATNQCIVVKLLLIEQLLVGPEALRLAAQGFNHQSATVESPSSLRQ